NALDDGLELCFGDPGEDRKRQCFAGESFGDRKVAETVSELRVRTGQMDRLRIVAAGSDAARSQELGESVWFGGPQNMERPAGVAPGRSGRQREVADAVEMLGVESGTPAPLRVPGIQVRKFGEEPHRLQRVEAGRVALVSVNVLRRLAVFSE